MSLVSQFIAACGETGNIVENELRRGGQTFDLMADNNPAISNTFDIKPGMM